MISPSPETLAALHAQCFLTPRPWSAAEFATLLNSPLVFLVSQGAAFALGRHVAGEAELLTLAVAPENRRCGHGRACLAAYEIEALERGAKDSFLEVSCENAAAIALYLSAGYCESGRRTGYYLTPAGTRTDALILRKYL